MFTQKETGLLQDLKKYEQTCIEKYNKYASQACAEPLKTMFQQIGSHEQQHYQTLDQMITSGSAPATGGSQGGGQQQQGQQGQSAKQSNYSNDQQGYQNDSYLCTDALATEKHVSSVYDTCIFEFKEMAARNALNHIQKEEQQHGQQIYDYMSTNGMYS